MKYVDIIGVGMGADTLTAEAACALAQADLWLGAGSVLAQFAPADKPWQSGYTPAGGGGSDRGMSGHSLCRACFR